MKYTGLLILTLAAGLLAACGAPSPVAEPVPTVEVAPAQSEPDYYPQASTEEESAPEGEAEAPTEEAAAESQQPSAGATVFVIDPAQSEVRFVAHEVLEGAPNTVIGATSGVEGQIEVDPANASAAQVSTVRVDLSGLATDNSFRNRALSMFILESSNPQFQYAEFTPTEIAGLPDSAVVGQSYPVQITGDLTVKGTTSHVTFEGQVTLASDTQLEGSASLTASHEGLGVTIPRLPPQVASVEDGVQLEIDFVALAS